MPSTPSTNTLARGLRLLEQISSAASPVRFSELRDLLDGATDATLSRLLQTLETEGYVERSGKLGYTTGPRFTDWMQRRQDGKARFPEICHQLVLELSRQSNESAAIAILQEDRLVTLASHTAEDAISVLQPGQILHYEPDHAAALAFLDSQSSEEQKRLIQSPYSRLTQPGELESAVRKARDDETPSLFIDQSEARPGISRMGVAFQVGPHRGAAFLCLTTSQARAKRRALANYLLNCRSKLEET